QGADAAYGAATPIAVAGDKDCLRSAAPLVGQQQQAPTASSEALPLPLLLNRRRLMLFNPINGNGPCGSPFFALQPPIITTWVVALRRVITAAGRSCCD